VQPKQEEAHYFKQDNFGGLVNPDDVEPVPSPINGIRIKEDLDSYDNFIADYNGAYLEESTYVGQETFTSEDGKPVSIDIGKVPHDAAAAALVKQAGLGREDNENREDKSKSAKISAEQRTFFTWVVSSNLFLEDSDNPNPKPFNQAPTEDNAPEFTLVQKVRPGKNKSLVLTPFMRKNPPASNKSVNWGATLASPLPQNQPFEVIYYFDQRSPAPAKDASKLTPRVTFAQQNGSPVNGLENLSNSLYFVVEFGKEDPKNHYMILFKNDAEPMFFKMTSNTSAVLITTFPGFNGSRIFDPSNQFFSVKIEQVAFGLIIRSNMFVETPWILTGDENAPFVQGTGAISVYGGNVQAGFAFRPVQYHFSGEFSTPEVVFEKASNGGDPQCAASLKGGGETEQDRSYDEVGNQGKFGQRPLVQMVDAEQVSGLAVGANGIAAAGNPGGTAFNREIILFTEKVQSEDEEGGRDGVYQTKIILEITDPTPTYSGYAIERSRSPYIWMVRCELPALRGGDPVDQFDISCDVMSIDLTWSATSYQEISHTGSMKVLNRPNRGNRDYRSFTNRAIYLRIEAFWESSGDGGGGHAGHDPGPGQRNLFEGMAVGGEVSTRAETEIITFKLMDYMAALEGGKFQTCPYFDGMAASLAVRDIVLSTGFPDNRILKDSVPISQANLKGDIGLPPPRALGEGNFRWKDGTSYKEAILKMAKLGFKTIYFDRFGNFHYDDLPGGVFSDRAFPLLAEFWSSQIEGNINAAEDKKRLCWNMTSFSRLVNDVYNAIRVSTVDKILQAPLHAADGYSAGVSDPDAEGYLGYRKILIYADPILGNVESLYAYVDNYRRRVYIPPLTANFEIYGYTGLQPLSMIKVDGQLLRIMNISTHLSAAENQYWMRIEGEWFFSVGKGQDPALTPATGGSEASTYTGSG
jgi:hypothetical protein